MSMDNLQIHELGVRSELDLEDFEIYYFCTIIYKYVKFINIVVGSISIEIINAKLKHIHIKLQILEVTSINKLITGHSTPCKHEVYAVLMKL